ncbi:MAG: endonuclease/exonuclease/phosphatase family protein [Rikenellaceae bacterium]
MAEVYYDSFDRKQKKRSLIGIILDVVMLVVSLLCFVAISLTLVTSYYDPAKSWLFPVMGLITPAVYIATLLLALYWVIRWRLLYASLLILPLLVGIPGISRYYKIETSKVYAEPSRRGTIRLTSYNIREFVNDDQQLSTREMAEYFDELKPEVICLQEFVPKRMSEEDEPEIFKKYNRVKLKELAIFTRYNILDSSENLISEEDDSGCAMWADLQIGTDTIRLYNIHLQSTAITVYDNDYISNMEFISDSLSDDRFMSMLSRFRQSAIGRSSQADTVALSIKESPHRVIVCGDFNDTPNSYTYRKIAHGLQDSFQEAGTGYSYTFRGFMNLLRIDYILVEKPTQVLSYEVTDSLRLSDHLPITTTLKL